MCGHHEKCPVILGLSITGHFISESDFFDDDDFAFAVALDHDGKAHVHQAVSGEDAVVLNGCGNFLVIARLGGLVAAIGLLVVFPVAGDLVSGIGLEGFQTGAVRHIREVHMFAHDEDHRLIGLLIDVLVDGVVVVHRGYDAVHIAQLHHG